MRTIIFLFAVGLCLPVGADTSGKHYPWNGCSWDRFGVGSWANYKVISGGDSGSECTPIIKEFALEQVALTYKDSLGRKAWGKVWVPRRIQLERDFFDYRNSTVIGRGTETISVGRRQIPCRWVSYSQESDDGKSQFKIWYSWRVPEFVVRSKISFSGDAKLKWMIEFIDFEVKPPRGTR